MIVIIGSLVILFAILLSVILVNFIPVYVILESVMLGFYSGGCCSSEFSSDEHY